MISKNKKLLKVLNDFKDEYNEIGIDIEMEKVIFSRTDYKTYTQYISAIKALAEDGYVTYEFFFGSERPHEPIVMLTHKGVHYKAYTIEAVKQFLLKSVAVPIVVAIITAFLTTWIKLSLTPPPQQQKVVLSQTTQTE